MKRFLKIILIVLCVLFVTSCSSCVKSDWFSEEFHLKQIRKRIEKKYISGECEYESYEIYPLYDENDEFLFYLVEFEPQGFLYVNINEEVYTIARCLGGRGMYTKSSVEGVEDKWQRYRIEIDGGEGAVKQKKTWEKDATGNDVYYECSPYKAANILNEKLYLLNIKKNGDEQIPAVRREDKYLNLVSLELFEYNSNLDFEMQATTIIGFWPKKEADL